MAKDLMQNSHKTRTILEEFLRAAMTEYIFRRFSRPLLYCCGSSVYEK